MATIVWFRKDFRLSDHAALTAAVARGQPIIPVFILDEVNESYGAAPKWRLEQAVAHFADVLAGMGSRLILRRGRALDVLQKLVRETGATAVYWQRAYDPWSQERDRAVKAGLAINAQSFTGHVLFEPWSVKTKTGGFYKVYTPMWKAVRDRDVPTPLPAPKDLPTPETWPASECLSDWGMGRDMNRGADIVAHYANIGEARAHHRLNSFIADNIAQYHENRDFPAVTGTSRLSENLAWGEISPAQCWHAGLRARDQGALGAETFLKELVWREFAYHLLHHTPHIADQNWRPEWQKFPWRTDGISQDVQAWERGQTGIPFVDAAMRELYTTGTMHNRARMIAASFLTKHLLVHWRIGQAWFEDCLIDWDPASNAMGWQWVAGSGPDAAPFFRIFNPDTQAKKFDPDGAYCRAWLAQGSKLAGDFYRAIPRSWGMGENDPYPDAIIDLKTGRERALHAYQNSR